MTKMPRADQRQLTFVFADNPNPGRGQAAPLDVSEAKAWLRHIAKVKESNRSAAKVEPLSGDLLERIASRANLAQAVLNVVRNQGAAGSDGMDITAVLGNVRALLDKVRHALLSARYRPGDIRRVWIPKPGGGQRGLGIPNVIDRWVQEAIRQVLTPLFEPHFHASSHGFRPKRGAHTAVAQAQALIEEGYTTLVDLDLSEFFDRVHHQRLLNRLAQRASDGRVLQLIHRLLKAKVVLPNGAVIKVHEGTPQGGPLSPLLSNIVLDELDWELERRGLRFVRYADDVTIFVRSERAGDRVMASVRCFIDKRLRLKVNDSKSRVTDPDRVHFLGFRFRQNPEGVWEVFLSQRSDRGIRARIRELTARNWGRSLESCITRLNRYLRGWEGYFGRLCTPSGVDCFKAYDSHIRRRLRAIIVRQKRRPRYLFRHLLRRGVRRKHAVVTAFSQRRAWSQSITMGMHRAYPNAWFESRVYTLWNEWQRKHPGPFMVSDGQYLLFTLEKAL
jgi:RNA-directed DNA polymerase